MSRNLFLSHLKNLNALLGETNAYLARCFLKLGLSLFILEKSVLLTELGTLNN